MGEEEEEEGTGDGPVAVCDAVGTFSAVVRAGVVFLAAFS